MNVEASTEPEAALHRALPVWLQTACRPRRVGTLFSHRTLNSRTRYSIGLVEEYFITGAGPAGVDWNSAGVARFLVAGRAAAATLS